MTVLAEHLEASSGWLKRDDRPIWAWADGYCGMDRTRPRGERWSLNRTPYVAKVLDDWRDGGVREIVLMAAAGAAKTTPMQLAITWHIEHDPCPIAWVTCNDELADDASLERITPMLENTPSTAALILPGHRSKTLTKIRTRFCTVDIGAASQASTFEQRRYRVFIGDECRKWDEGSLSRAQNRQIGYEDAKRCFCSTAGDLLDEFDRHFLQGNQAEWMIPCMGCGEMLPFVWAPKYSRLPAEIASKAQFKYDDTKLWLECAKCGHQHHETPEVKRYICEKGIWVDMNPQAAKRVRSYHWMIFIAPWSKWNEEVLPKWRIANAALESGNVILLKEFIQETLAEPWREDVHIEKKEIVMASYRMDALNIAGSTDWKYVFMTCDVGKRDFWHIVRGWNPGAHTKMLAGGRLRYWAELHEAAARFGLTLKGRQLNGLPSQDSMCKRVFLDARYEDPELQEVHRECATMGWTTFIGTDKDFFEITDDKGNVHRFLYSKPRFFNARTGVHSDNSIIGVEFSVATPTSQDILDELLSGRVGKLEIPEDAPQQYQEHLRNEPKVFDVVKRTNQLKYYRKRLGPQHLRDCECLQIIAASMVKCIAEIPSLKETANGKDAGRTERV